MADQLAAGFWFKMPEGYTGAYLPAGFLPFFNGIIRLRDLTGKQQAQLALAEFNSFIRQTETQTVILPDRPEFRTLEALLTRDLQNPPIRELGVQVWHVDPLLLSRLRWTEMEGQYWQAPGSLSEASWMDQYLRLLIGSLWR
jgi:hypothetical protein